MITFNCDYCGAETEKATWHYNRAKRLCLGVYCDRKCAGLGRRSNKSKEQKKAEKAEYDKIYRTENLEKKIAWAKEYHKRTYDPEKAAIERKKKMPRHVEYCRQPKYKKYKQEYDKQYRAKKDYGDYGEAALILFELEDILERKSPDMLILKFQNNTLNKSQKRKRKWKHSTQSR